MNRPPSIVVPFDRFGNMMHWPGWSEVEPGVWLRETIWRTVEPFKARLTFHALEEARGYDIWWWTDKELRRYPIDSKTSSELLKRSTNGQVFGCWMAWRMRTGMYLLGQA